MANIVATEALSASSSPSPALASAHKRQERRKQNPSDATDDWRPKRLVRTVLGSMADSNPFSKQMEREAKRRRFFEANTKAFLGDGLPWNWSSWKRHFSDLTPILDFIRVPSYLFLAAKAVHNAPQDT